MQVPVAKGVVLVRGFRLKSFIVSAAMFVAVGVGFAQTRSTTKTPSASRYVEQGQLQRSVLYADGREIEVPTEVVWRPVCGSDHSRVTVDELRRVAEIARQAELAHLAPTGGVATASTGFDLVFNLTSALPEGSAEALLNVERYIEAQFSDPITVVINFGFTPLSPGVLGQTGSSYAVTTWANTRAGLQAGMDFDDTIQDFLPAGATIPVRYNGNTTTVTDEDRVFVTIGNYRAAIGSIGGTAATITMNSNFFWDYTPPDITGGAFCFQSVMAHEIGHALGFTSGADGRASDIEVLDLYRFQLSNGSGTNHNPDNLAEFGTTARMVDTNAPGTADDVNSDLITAEYRMSDGNPFQASHFSNQQPGIYVMDPALSSTETFYPDFYRVADSAMFDAIGWDFPPANTSCPDSIPLQCGSTKSLDTSTNIAAPDPVYSCGNGTAHRGTLWYSFVAGSTSARISTCGSDGTDSTFAVYRGECDHLTEIGCSEDGGCSSKPGLSVICLTDLLVGETYWIQISSGNAAAQRSYLLQYDCNCPGACCLPPPGNCTTQTDTDCAAMGGGYAGPGTTCVGDLNDDTLEDACEQSHVEFSQLPTAATENTASNLDTTDLTPADTVTDDFTSDGRPIHAVRWWGSTLDAAVPPDGWFIGFYEPQVVSGSPAAPLGLYYCDDSVVSLLNTPIPACDAHAVIGYEARLFDCCLIQATIDSRGLAAPAEREAFYQELCLDYELAIHAVVGTQYDRDSQSGECIASPTGSSAPGAYWGWHRTGHDLGNHVALLGAISNSGGDWVVGPMSALTTGCGPTHAAFELVTTEPPGEYRPILWDNGIPDNEELFGSQSGGQETDWMTVDDFEFASAGTLQALSFTNEEEPAFVWSGRARLEIYPDTGSLAPDESGAPMAALWIPDDAGVVVRQDLGMGQSYERWRYDITGLSLAIPAGRWWVGLATAGEMGSTGRAYWTSSHTVPPGTILYGGEAHIRAPSLGIPTFTPWSTFVAGRQSDVTFRITNTVELDCNCNGLSDETDVLLATSADCNTNGIPDECEYDCNANGIPDECDMTAQTAADCQANGVIDECEVFLGLVTDSNLNGIPDLCCEAASAPTEPILPAVRNRTITIHPGQSGQRTAIRVRLVNLQDPNPPNTPANPPRDFSAFENTFRWVGAPQVFPETSSPLPTFDAAALQCEPYFMDWSTFDILHVYGPEIMPSSQYEVQAIEEACYFGGQSTAFSSALLMATRRWGDVVDPFQPPSENPQPDGLDIVALVNKFKGLAGAPIKASAKLSGATLNLVNNVNGLDISAGIDAFKGLAYPFQGVVACPP